MRLNPADIDLLTLLTSMPFLDRIELAAIVGRSRATVYERVSRLGEAGLLDAVVHANELFGPTRRYCLTARGLRRLAEERQEPLGQLLHRHPVSEQWRRLILERLDAAAPIYRLCETASHTSYPLSLRWYRASPVDAVLELPDGRRAAIVRQGGTNDRTAFAKRIRRLRETPGFGAVLLICPDETRLRYTRRLVAGGPVITLLALEPELARSGPETAFWRPPSGSVRLTLREALALTVDTQANHGEPPLARVSAPRALNLSESDRPWLLSAQLSASEKRAVDVICDWPWICPFHMSSLLGISRRRSAHLLSRLDDLGLLTRVSQASKPRLALSERGLAHVGRRDRASVGAARKRWSASSFNPAAPVNWRNTVGSRARQLLRNLDHTESVHWFNALLAAQALERMAQIVQLDPPHRASRYFRSEDGLRSIHPDAFVLLRSGECDWACFLEWERRAIRPATMAARLAPYLRYYATDRPLEDHGLLPAVLVAFEDELAATHFLGVAREAIARTGVELPLLVSDRDSLEHGGPLGPVWRSPDATEPRSPF